ncbi:MAG: PEP-CTERM sorting domain-containing protein [Janthinobacterium lividum]
MTKFSSCLTTLALALAAFGSAGANAAAVAPTNDLVALTFNFNDINLGLKSNTSGLGSIALSNGIALSLTSALQTATKTKNVSVDVVDAIATQTYNGEGYVKGDTLGTSDGGIHLKTSDTFLINNNFGMKQGTTTTAVTGGTKSDAFTLTFSNFLVTSVQFDYEIFPDAVCQNGSGCLPDISLLVDGVQRWADSANPGVGTIQPTKLGTTGLISFSEGSTLTFKDWPAEIGIDNLRITGCYTAVDGKCASTTTTVPEPLTLALLGAGILGFGASRRRSAKKAA